MATTEVKVPTTLTAVQLIEFAQQMAILMDAVTIGQIVNVGVVLAVDISGLGLTGAPGSTADVEEKGVFMYNAVGGFRTTVQVPCLADTDVIPGSDEIDLTDADILAFNTAMISGLLLPVGAITVSPTDSREADITSLDWARERFRASGKRV